MRFAILFSLALIGCGGASPDPTESNSTSSPGESYNYDSPSSGNSQPCDKPTFIVVNGVETEVPSLCNQNLGPDKGDPPPDFAVDPDPWDKSSVKTNSIHISEREAQGNAVR